MRNKPVTARLNRAIHNIPSSGVIYIENPKVACSNIKWSLINAYCKDSLGVVQNVHDRRQTPFSKNGRRNFLSLIEADADIFSVVRHPRRRFISAYFDKMFYGRDESVWLQLAEQLDLSPQEVHAPKIVLNRMLDLPRQDLDPHAALQAVNLFWENIPYSRVLYLEKIPTAGVISTGSRCLTLLDQQSHSTKSRVDMSLFDEETLELIDTYYAPDYERFGYVPQDNSPEAEEVPLPDYRRFFLSFLNSESPLKVLRNFFLEGPRALTQSEMVAVIDYLSVERRWEQCSHRILDFLVARNFAREPEIISRYAERTSLIVA